MSIWNLQVDQNNHSAEQLFRQAKDEVWRMNIDVELISGENLVYAFDVSKRIEFQPGTMNLVFISAKQAAGKCFLNLEFEKTPSFKVGDTVYLMSAVKCYKKNFPFLVGEYKRVLVGTPNV